MARTESNAKALVSEALKKSKDSPESLEKSWSQASLVARYGSALFKREYETIPWRSIILGALAFVYVVNPLDLVPDAIPILGWLDDATAMGFVLASIKADLTKFTTWESARDQQPEATAEAAGSGKIIDVEAESGEIIDVEAEESKE